MYEINSSNHPQRLLMLGNSFTFFNEMPSRFLQPMLNAARLNVQVTAVTRPNYYLHQYFDESLEAGQAVRALLREQHFDFVLIQEQSNLPIADPPAFYRSVRVLNRLIRESGATPWLYQTWGYGAGNEDLAQFGENTQQMEMKLRASYQAIGRELSIPVAPVGAAMTRALDLGVADLYNQQDHYHPSAVASEMIAKTLMASLFGVHPQDVPFVGAADAETRALLDSAADWAAFSDVTADPKYQMDSVRLCDPAQN